MHSDTSKLQQQQDFQSGVNNVSAQNLQSAAIAADAFRFLEYIQHNLFDAVPDKTALFYAGEAISYPQLGQNVAKIMFALQQKDLQAGAVVAVCLPKSAEHVYAVLACALLGIIWLPVDMDAPEARRDYLLSNSKVDVVIAKAQPDGWQCVLIDDVLATPAPEKPECSYALNKRAAYYLYTSGSTGIPKCVVLNNLATANVLGQTIGRWNMHRDDVLMAVTPFHHDMSVFDVFAAMALGASLVIPTPAQVKDACAWAQLVATHNVTIWVSVPAIVDMLCSVARVEQLQSLRLVAQGGDYVKPALIQYLRQHLPHARLFSLGGPTETTIWSIWHEITAEDVDVIPYGRALAHNQYYILNEQLQPCAVGEVGQMYMAGVNLSNGYLLDGQLLTGDFVSLQCAAGKTALRMSDLGYVRADGNIIFAGRAEGYLKIKGVRISAAEVEVVLAKSGCLQDGVVVCCTHPVTSMHELVAVYTLPAGRQNVDINALKQHLLASLPKSHVPTRWLAIDQIPLTRNVKVDRKRIQQMAQERLYQAVPAQAAAAAGQNQAVADSVVAIFRDCRPQQADDAGDISVQSEILVMGLRLKQLMMVASRITERFNIQLDAPALVRCKTVQDVVYQVQQKMLN
jgi:amino acid adenylation domain-containing protein